MKGSVLYEIKMDGWNSSSLLCFGAYI